MINREASADQARIVESILLRRIALNRIEGFTLETSAEIVAAIFAARTPAR